MDLLTSHGLNFDGYFYWVSVGALIGFTVLFDIGFILALTYMTRTFYDETKYIREVGNDLFLASINMFHLQHRSSLEL